MNGAATTPTEGRRPGLGRRLAAGYRGLALLALNTLVVLLCLNLVAALALAVYERALAPPTGPLRYGMSKLKQVYPGRSESEIGGLLRETWSRQYIYAPFVQHREAPFAGRWVNVDENGFRHSAQQGPWPPRRGDPTVFVFGGSTTFGYGVADDETVPSRLQAALAERGCGSPRVYNFGRGNYYGEQERVLFAELLSTAAVPDLAVFIDGLNEWKDSPKFTPRLEHLMQPAGRRPFRQALKELPVVRLLLLLRPAEAAAPPAAAEADRELGTRAVERWLRGKRIIERMATEFGVRAIFVWQPVPTYEYDLESHLFAAESAASLARHGALQHGYRWLDARRADSPALEPAGDFLWLADMQRGRRQPLYVDAAHYTAEFSAEIAGRIGDFVAGRALCPGAGPGEVG